MAKRRRNNPPHARQPTPEIQGGLTPKPVVVFNGPAIDPDQENELIELLAEVIAAKAIRRMQTNG